MRLILALCATFALIAAHSEMICGDYDRNTNTCKAPVRNTGQTLIQQSYVLSANPGQICQVAYRSPVSSFYSNGAGCPSWAACPQPMGTIKQGSTFTVMWYARNHAVANQSPGNVQIYLSPQITASTTSDPTLASIKNNKICEGSFSNCPTGHGDTDKCYLDCTMPSTLANGNYTLLWYWDWTSNDGKIYSTCSDVVVGGASASTTGVRTTTATTATTATVATTAAATTGVKTTTASTSSSSTTGGSTTGGISTGCESVILVRYPKMVTSKSTFNVTVAYRGQASRDIVVDLINGNNWYGKGTVTVPAGKGYAQMSIMVQNAPANGANYALHAWTVNQGMANVANAWNSAYDNDSKTIAVGNAVSY